MKRLPILACFAFALCAPTLVHAGPFGKAKKRLEDGGKKIAKAAKGAKKGAESALKKSRNELKKAGKKVSKTTGSIAGVIKKAAVVTGKELGKAAKYTAKKFEEAGKALGRLAKKAVQKAYRKVWKRNRGSAGKIATAAVRSQGILMPKLMPIAGSLLRGRHDHANAAARKLLSEPAMQPLLAEGRGFGAKSFVILADVDGGGYYGGVTGALGIAVSLSKGDHPRSAVFVASGGVVSTDYVPNGGIGVAVGFFRDQPAKIGGPAVELMGGVSAGVKAFGVTMTFPPPTPKPPFVSGKPSMIIVTLGAGLGGLPANLAFGGSYTHIIQKVR